MSFDSKYYIHDSDRIAMKGLKAIPGFNQFVKAFMKIWSERQYRIFNMSSCIKISEKQMSEYYNMLPPICEKLGIDVPELYVELNVQPNSYTSGDTKPFIVITSGLFETLPEELISTVLAHECGHIACHHVLYNTMGRILLSGASNALLDLVPLGLGGIASMSLEIAFFYWMRCSELSADRAAILCDGSSDKMSEVCMRLAGFDKDIPVVAYKENFIEQAKEYRNIVSSSKWDKTLEFFALRYKDHPFMSVRALECEEWGSSEKFNGILKGTYVPKNPSEAIEKPEGIFKNIGKEIQTAGKQLTKADRGKTDFLKFGKDSKAAGAIVEEKDEVPISVPDEIRKYKELLDEELITQEEFDAKKKQLLNL